MQVSAVAQFIRIAPRKVRLVVDAVRGMEVDQALAQLQFMNKRASLPVSKLIRSAISNAEHNYELAKDNLFIKEIKVDEAPTLKRWMPRAHGRATTIRKRGSHIRVMLGEIKDSGEKQAKQHVIEAPVKLGAAAKKEDTKEHKNSREQEAETTDKADDAEAKTEKGKEIIDTRREGRGGHAQIEKKGKGFTSKMFRRKSG